MAMDPQSDQNEKLKKFLEMENANAPPPGPMPGTNPILDAMHAQQMAIPTNIQQMMAGSAQANAQNDLAAAQRRKQLDEMSGRHSSPW